MNFLSKLPLSRQKLEFYYSIAIMILIPAAIVANTFFLTAKVRSDYDGELGRKADAVNTVLGVSIRDRLDNPETLQGLIDEISEANEEILELSILAPKADSSNVEYEVQASSVHDAVGQTVTDPRFNFAIRDQRSVSSLQRSEDGVRSWGVATPILLNDEVVGMVSINFGFEKVDQLVSELFSRSLYALIVVVAIVLLLLLNHFKFVEYAQLFKKLKEVDQMKSDFLSVATHELKSPMAVIKGSLENITDGVFGQPNQGTRESIELALGETDRLVVLVTDLLNVSRIEQGRISYKYEPVNMVEVINRIIAQYKPRAAEKNIQIKYAPEQAQYIVNADQGRILEIFTNLIDNAIKYSEKGEVEISHKLQDSVVRTTVRDTGIGMSAKERENLFSRFYRVQNDKTARISGTGLGLWIIKQYIEAMGGKIYVDSLEGVGSEFAVEFRIMTEPTPSQNPN